MLIFEKVYIHPSNWKMYNGIDHVVACGFMACFTTSKISKRITLYIPVHMNTFKSNSRRIALCLQPDIVVLKPHPLTVATVAKCIYYY